MRPIGRPIGFVSPEARSDQPRGCCADRSHPLCITNKKKTRSSRRGQVTSDLSNAWRRHNKLAQRDYELPVSPGSDRGISRIPNCRLRDFRWTTWREALLLLDDPFRGKWRNPSSPLDRTLSAIKCQSNPTSGEREREREREMQSEIDDELLGFIALVDDPGLYQWQV